MKVSRNHHYIPKAILRNFCFSNNSIYYVRKSDVSRKVSERNISSVFKRGHYNSLYLRNERRDDSVEKFFAYQLDNYIPGWVDLFQDSIQKGAVSFSSDLDRNRFIQFFFNHMKRSPDFIEKIVKRVAGETFYPGFVDDLAQKFRPVSEEERRHILDAETQERIINNSRVVNLSEQSEIILDRLASLNIFVATPQRGVKQFIVGSNPVIRFQKYDRQPLGDDGVELWTTLTPKIAVGFARSKHNRDIILLSDDQVRKINSSITLGSSAIASKSTSLISSLATAYW